ncbi:cysteine desulfurase [Catellatospora sp. TT07R-123]|nr:cysteine desulfurase [Catellatospora sp. TT07R-123]
MQGLSREASEVIYLDYNATAPLRPEAWAAMSEALLRVGNASSAHTLGRWASERAESARNEVGHLIGAAPNEIIFTSGATEANNLALHAAAVRAQRVVVSAVEHPAVLEAARALPVADLRIIGVDEDGLLLLDELEDAVAGSGGSVVSVMAANNETGVLTDLAAITKITRRAGALLHVDATQLVGKLPMNLSLLDIDLLSLSAHKFGGPQGVGALFLRRGCPVAFEPLLRGGGQERGWRSGTLNVAGVVGMGAAARAAADQLEVERRRVMTLRDHLEAGILATVNGVERNGHPDFRLPGVSSLAFRGIPADALLSAMPGVAASDGSACASGALTPSHVLLAMHRSREHAESTVRFSLGHATTAAEIEEAIMQVGDAVRRVRTAMS